MGDRYDPGPGENLEVVKAALRAAEDTIDWQMADASAVVLTFLKHMDANYVGDYYIEGSLGYLATLVGLVAE